MACNIFRVSFLRSVSLYIVPVNFRKLELQNSVSISEENLNVLVFTAFLVYFTFKMEISQYMKF